MMAKFAQYYLKYNLEHMFSAEYKDQRQLIFGAFFETNESIDFVLGEGEDQKVYKHQVYHLSQNKDIIVMRIANDRKKPSAWQACCRNSSRQCSKENQSVPILTFLLLST